MELAMYEQATADGRVKFYKSEKGWGGIEGPELAGDVWVHFSAIEGAGYRYLTTGQRVSVTYERANQDSWRYRAISVRPLEPPAPYRIPN